MNVKKFFKLIILVSCLVGSVTFSLLASPHPLIGRKAPEIFVKKWYNLNQGQSIPKLKLYEGKIVYIYCYQSWCPGCHRYGFPSFKKLADRYTNNDDIVFLAVQTVFEGFETNTAEKIELTRKKYQLDIPFGHDDGNGNGSQLMKDYYSGGTPWHIIIDKKGKIMYCGFHIDVEKTIAALDSMLQ